MGRQEIRVRGRKQEHKQVSNEVNMLADGWKNKRKYLSTRLPRIVPSSCPKSINAFPRPLYASTKNGSIRRASL